MLFYFNTLPPACQYPPFFVKITKSVLAFLCTMTQKLKVVEEDALPRGPLLKKGDENFSVFYLLSGKSVLVVLGLVGVAFQRLLLGGTAARLAPRQ